MGSSAIRTVAAAALAIGNAACASMMGLDDYSKTQYSEGYDGGRDDGGRDDGAVGRDEGGATGKTFAQDDADDTPLPEDEARDASVLVMTDAGDAEEGTDDAHASGFPTSVAKTFLCAVGGCNTATGACSDRGQGCYCTSDAQCVSGQCVKNVGENDLSCGAACTGSGGHDGFNCALTGSGIPMIASTGFGYTPSNFVPSRSAVPDTDTLIDCNATYDTRAHAFTNWCPGRTLPSISANVSQSNGPAVDILSFHGLTVLAGAALNIVSSDGGGNAVVLAVYGDASVLGAIHADGETGSVTDGGTSSRSGPGGAFNCGKGAGQDQGNDNHCSGGSGAGASAAGGSGAGGVEGTATAGGVARPNASIQPLYGGCPGGASGSWACTTSGGGGGGALQISVAGSLVVTGSITANGGDGGTSACKKNAGCNVYGGGGGGGGSGGAILLEGEAVTTLGSTITVNGGKGGAAMNGGAGGEGGTASSPGGQPGTGHSPAPCSPPSQCGGGGGGAYGYLAIHAANRGVCATTLVPAPVANARGTSCLCVADSNCPSGKCVNAGSQCTGSCTGTGVPDSVGCELVVSQPSSWSCPNGNCSSVDLPDGLCAAEGIPCWCTNDSDCPGGKCAAWAGCAADACTGSGGGDGFHCVH